MRRAGVSPAGREAPAGTADRARRLLARRDGWIEAAPGGYGVRAGKDRRTRVLLAVDEAVFRQLAENPGLKARPGGGWVARAAASASLSLGAPEAGRPGVIEGVRAVMESDGGIIVHRANLDHSAVVWLARRTNADGRAWLTPAEIAAADRLAREPRSRCAGRRSPCDGTPCRVRVRAATRRVETALAACGSAREMIEAICIRSSALQAAERDLGLRRRQGKTLLKTGLTALAAHYRIG